MLYEVITLAAAALGAANARELFWREGRAHPCGATGGLDAVQPKVAGELADARLADAGAAGASVLVTEDPACVTHLASRPGTLKVVSLFELLAAQLAG